MTGNDRERGTAMAGRTAATSLADNWQPSQAQAGSAVGEHWSSLLTASCQLVARAPASVVASARVSQRGCGVPSEAELVQGLADDLADEFSLTARVTSTGARFSVRFYRRAAAQQDA